MGFGVNTKDSHGSLRGSEGLPAFSTHLGLQPRRPPVRRHDRDRFDRPLDDMAQDAALPRHLADSLEANVYKRRLLSLCRHLEAQLQTPVSVKHDADGRTVTVFGSVAYRVDDSSKTISPGRVDRDGRFRAADYRVELLRPLCTSWWLRLVIQDLGVSDRSDQGHLLLSDQEIADAETWLADTAYCLLKADLRFQQIRFQGLPQALNLDPELTTIALGARPRGRRLHLLSNLYSTVWQYETEFRRVAGENPRLLPLLAVCAQKRGLDPNHDPVQQIRELFAAAGLSKAAWRYVTRHGARVFKLPWAMAAHQALADVAVEYLRVLDEAGLPPPPPPAVINAWLRVYVARGTDRVHFRWGWCDVPRDVLAIALRQADRHRYSDSLAAFVEAFLGVVQWAGATTPTLDKNQRRAGWPWLVRRWRAWEREEQDKAKAEGLEWDSAVLAFEHGPYWLTPLCSGRELVEEGIAMRNCMASLAPDCVAGNVRLFSVRRRSTGGRVACIGILRNREAHNWQVFDVKGFANKPVGRGLANLARYVAECHSRCETNGSFAGDFSMERQSEMLFESARELSDDEAGGHGNRWGVFDEDVERIIGRWLTAGIEKSQIVDAELSEGPDLGRLIRAGEPKASGLLYADRDDDQGKAGMLSVIALNMLDDATGERRNILCSTYPFFRDGAPMDVEVGEIAMFPNRLEARLELVLEDGPVLIAFDSLFWKHRARYEAQEDVRFSLAALAYTMTPAKEKEFVIDDPERIRAFRARDAWLETHGQWSKEDEAASLAAYRPTSEEDLEPIRICTGQMAAYLPTSAGPADDFGYQGEVVRVVPQAHVLFGVTFWRVDVVVLRPGGVDLALPFYVAAHLFPAEWRPQSGEYVTGSAWLQGYLCA